MHVAPRSPFRLWPPLVVAVLLAACAAAPVVAPAPGAPPGIVLATTVVPPPWDGVAFRGGVVAASHPLAAQAGADVLARGGNAIDAAVAVQFVLNVVEPQYSGIGGGGFTLIHLARERRTFTIDAREAAPAAATPAQFMFSGVPEQDRFVVASTSGVSVGVPGALAAADMALQRWGTISLADALAPAIRLAEQGVRVNRFLAASIANDYGRAALQPETAALFRPHGVPLAEGDLLVQPDLAKTLRLIATQGVGVFYRGEVAQALVAAQRRSRSPQPAEGAGRMTLQDLASYRAIVREPLQARYRGWTLATMGPPSSGGLTVAQMLGLVERFPIGDAAQGFGFGSAATLHVMTEAMRLGFADRAVWMGDADFVPVPGVGLLNHAYVAARSAQIERERRMATPAAGNPLPFDRRMRGGAAPHLPALDSEADKPSHTTHFTIVDRWGNVASATTPIEALWGSGIMVPGYGFLLNNELTDFNLEPTADAATGNPGANDVAGGKRSRSAIAPVLLFRGTTPVASWGAPGGATIINSVFNVALNLIDHHMSMQQAIDAPRLSVTSPAGTIACEGGQAFMQPRFSVATQDALRALGHHGLGAAGTDACQASIGSVQGIVIDLRDGRRYGGADRRREGAVIGQVE